MSDAENKPTHRPTSGAKIKPLAYLVAAQFHPAIKLTKKAGIEFASSLSGIFDTRGIDLQENLWVFSNQAPGQPATSPVQGIFQVSVRESIITMEAMFPGDSQELLERRYELILDGFRSKFKPALLLNSSASVRATLQIDGDARTFLTTHVTNFDKDKFKTLGRPLHLFGIRLMMPPYSLQTPPTGKKKKSKVVSSADWAVDVKAESSIEDTSKLYLEASAAGWPTPCEWDGNATKSVVGRLKTVSDFLNENLIPLLTHGNNERG